MSTPNFHFVFVVFALVCFILSAWQAAAPNWNKLISAGLAFLALAMLG